MSMTDLENIATATDADRFDAAFTDKPPVTADKPVVEAETVRTDDGGEATARDEHGRFKAKADEPEPKVGADGKPVVEAVTEPEHRIPLAEHLSERERRQTAERRAEDLDRRVRDFERREREAARPKRERPDLLADPDAYDAYVSEEVATAVQRTQKQLEDRWINMCCEEAEEVHGEKFTKAWEAVAREADRDPQFRARMRSAPNPAKAAMRWFGQQEALREVGGDIGGYRKRIETEREEALLKDPDHRKKIMDMMRAEANGGGSDKTGSNVTTLPSLGRATGAGADRSEAGDIGSDGDRFSKVFSGKAR